MGAERVLLASCDHSARTGTAGGPATSLSYPPELGTTRSAGSFGPGGATTARFTCNSKRGTRTIHQSGPPPLYCFVRVAPPQQQPALAAIASAAKQNEKKEEGVEGNGGGGGLPRRCVKQRRTCLAVAVQCGAAATLGANYYCGVVWEEQVLWAETDDRGRSRGGWRGGGANLGCLCNHWGKVL